MDTRDDLALVFLGVIAFASLVQGLFLAGLAWGGLRVMKRVSALQRSFKEEVRPALDNVTRVTRNLAESSQRVGAQAGRLREVLEDATMRLESARAQVREAVASPGTSVRDVFAILKGLRRGLEVYRKLGALEAQGRGAARRYAGDEHLFI